MRSATLAEGSRRPPRGGRGRGGREEEESNSIILKRQAQPAVQTPAPPKGPGKATPKAKNGGKKRPEHEAQAQIQSFFVKQ